ncbi:Enhancer of rudimentary -like protein [Halotydeus destructor]|nr:Enhancer of rudimentary -like protein [Halotydeus destructor]
MKSELKNKNHCIVLLQPDSEETRTYTEFESVSDAVEGLRVIFEENTNKTDYIVSELVEYFMAFDEMLFLVYDFELKNYTPYDSVWIKQKIQENIETEETMD